MAKFLKLKSSEEFIQLIKTFSPISAETIDIDNAAGRVLATEIYSPEDLPPFHRSSMDGYALRARDTFGLSETEPMEFQVKGEVLMGREIPHYNIGGGECMRIWTGGQLPNGADSVVMEEYTRQINESTIEVFKPVAPYENVIKKGEDIEKDSLLFSSGKRLTPYDTGILAALGITKVSVRRKPKVAIISTGDEIVSKDAKDIPIYKIRDVNSTALSNLLHKYQCIPKYIGICKDEFNEIRESLIKAMESGADMILLSGGSSIGIRDLTLKSFESIDGMEILVHGVEIRPGKPTILGRVGNIPFVGLPGHITSAIVVFQVFIRILINVLCGSKTPERDFLRTTHAVASRNIPSVSGREDYVRVKFMDEESLKEKNLKDNKNLVLPLVQPVFGKSGTIRSLIESNGLIKIPRDSEGIYGGDIVEVMLHD